MERESHSCNSARDSGLHDRALSCVSPRYSLTVFSPEISSPEGRMSLGDCGEIKGVQWGGMYRIS